jgi:hypothetical protein
MEKTDTHVKRRRKARLEQHTILVDILIEGPVNKARYKELAQGVAYRLDIGRGDIYSFPGVEHHFVRFSPVTATERKLRRYLRDLVKASRNAVEALDQEMQNPSTYERGKRVAQITNHLEYLIDSADHFGLGNPLRGSKPARSTPARSKGGRT